MPADAEKRGIPLIHISPEQGKFLQVLMAATNATKVLEVGSLFGYSTLWMARALPADGTLHAIELSKLHAQTTRENIVLAGLSDRVKVHHGDAREVLPTLASEAPFDLAFIDAEKAQYVDYFEQVMQLMRPGGMVIADNASANGNAWQTNPKRDREHILAIRAMNQRMASDPRLTSLLVPISDGMCVGVVSVRFFYRRGAEDAEEELTYSSTRESQKRCAKLVALCQSLPEVMAEGDPHIAITVRSKTFAYYQFNHHGDGMVSLVSRRRRASKHVWSRAIPSCSSCRAIWALAAGWVCGSTKSAWTGRRSRR